ncbi:MAG: sulfate ABC transporter substrate-binding protein [Planctomycetales bacterium]|jgi:sulfate transport system substrate-binding protein|nr:sulfate ABC transporter substrate-binding protein [Planctomycetales bacterium]
MKQIYKSAPGTEHASICRPIRQLGNLVHRPWVVVLLVAVIFGCAKEPDPSISTGETPPAPQEITLLNVSYDPTRELWKEINNAFIPAYEKETGIKVSIKQSHGSSGSQARAIIDGLEADVATLSIWSDTNSLQKAGLIKERWEETFPDRSLPYTSTIVFVTRKGNPKNLKDWPDLIKGDTQIITPSPRTSGNGKLSFLAAWGSVISTGGSQDDARKLVTELYRRVPVLDAGARGATTTFAQKGVGDVHLALENEAMLEVRESSGQLEIVYPPVSIIHEPHIAIVDNVVDARGTRGVAQAYLQFLYTDEGQQIIASNYFRPAKEEVRKKFQSTFPELKTFTISDFATDWEEANAMFFVEGGIFDQLYEQSAHTK